MSDSAVALAKTVAYWQSLTPETVGELARYYTEDAYFRDPFSEVRGLPAIRRIFDGMFVRLVAPRFRITDTVLEQDRAFLIWDFTFRIRSFQPTVARTIHGTTHVRFAADGRVSYHRDYWDTAAELYEQLPLLGSVLRALRRKFA